MSNKDLIERLRSLPVSMLGKQSEEKVYVLAQDAADALEKLDGRLRDTEWLFRAYFVLATESGIKPRSSEMIEAAQRYYSLLESPTPPGESQ